MHNVNIHLAHGIIQRAVATFIRYRTVQVLILHGKSQASIHSGNVESKIIVCGGLGDSLEPQPAPQLVTRFVLTRPPSGQKNVESSISDYGSQFG
jgi:hypothetical protein